MGTDIRKKYVLNPRFQLSVVLWFSMLFFVVMLVFGVANWYFFYKLTNEALQAGLPAGHIFFTFIDQQKSSMLTLFVLASVGCLLSIIVGGILLSHKIAGPIYRFTVHLNSSKLSEVKPINFRRGDYFLELRDSFNEFIKRK